MHQNADQGPNEGIGIAEPGLENIDRNDPQDGGLSADGTRHPALVIHQSHFTKNRTLTERTRQEVFVAVTEAFANFDFARLDDICLSAQITFLEHQIARLISTGPEFPFGFGVLGVHQRL